MKWELSGAGGGSRREHRSGQAKTLALGEHNGITQALGGRKEKQRRHNMNITYHNPLIKQLRDQQVRVASRDKKLEHVNRAERLLAELDPKRNYPYDYL